VKLTIQGRGDAAGIIAGQRREDGGERTVLDRPEVVGVGPR